MVQRYRRGFNLAERTELWDRWQRGESLKAIGRAFIGAGLLLYLIRFKKWRWQKKTS